MKEMHQGERVCVNIIYVQYFTKKVFFFFYNKKLKKKKMTGMQKKKHKKNEVIACENILSKIQKYAMVCLCKWMRHNGMYKI